MNEKYLSQNYSIFYLFLIEFLHFLSSIVIYKEKIIINSRELKNEISVC
jgi:hypothetical protein